jgi:hypothetical protein
MPRHRESAAAAGRRRFARIRDPLAERGNDGVRDPSSAPFFDTGDKPIVFLADDLLNGDQ